MENLQKLAKQLRGRRTFTSVKIKEDKIYAYTENGYRIIGFSSKDGFLFMNSVTTKNQVTPHIWYCHGPRENYTFTTAELKAELKRFKL